LAVCCVELMVLPLVVATAAWSWDVDLADPGCGGADGDVERQEPKRVCLGWVSTDHQIACPPERHEASVVWWRSGLTWPLKEAYTTPHSCGSHCRLVRVSVCIDAAQRRFRPDTSGLLLVGPVGG